MFDLYMTEARPGVLGNKGTKAIFFSGEQGNKGLKIRGTQVILGNREHTKSRFCFGGTRPLFRGNKETYPPSPWRASLHVGNIHGLARMT